MKKLIKIIFKGIRYFFVGLFFICSNKWTVAALCFCLFIALIGISTSYENEINLKDKEMLYTDEMPATTYYYDENLEIKVGDSAIDKKIKCYYEKIDVNNTNVEIKNYIDRLEQIYQSNGAYFSFLYQDLFSGFTVSYNEGTAIFTASTIKAPAMIYLYEKASLGEIDLNEKLTYTNNFYNGGSGVLKNKAIGTSYSVDELIYYTIHDSDNIAYSMLMNKYGRENIFNFWSNLGTKNIFSLSTIWGVTSAKDASIYMKELYRFYQNNDDYGKKLMEYFMGASWKLIKDRNGNYKTANKGGWAGTAIHDVAIVLDNNPYILVVMSELGESKYQYLFDNTSKLVGEMHEAYWKYKEDSCSMIAMY